MPPRTVLAARDLCLALFVVFFWALGFPVTEGALSALPPLLVAALRFALVAVCSLVVPRPAPAWRWIVLIGLFLLCWSGSTVCCTSAWRWACPPA
jgi:drug/metabolite transporter (DMT)-like permease